LAGLAIDDGLAERATRLVGAAAAIRKEIEAVVQPADRRTYESDLEAMRAELGSEAFESARNEGSLTDVAQAVAGELAR
jgi:hypothetical protein|tara:strand:+ start:307 stop:543 length:237 start_codon:yes stop_codon:yes gene_type:complete